MKYYKEILALLFMAFVIVYWSYQYSKKFNDNAKIKKELDSLKMVNLKLEIELMKIELQKH